MKKQNKLSNKNQSQEKSAQKAFAESDVIVILEDMRGDIRLIAEGQSGLRKEMNDKFEKVNEEIGDLRTEMRSKFSKIDNQFSKINGKFSKIDNQFSEINSQFKTVFEYLSRVEDELSEIKADIAEMKMDIKELKENSVSKSVFVALEDNVMGMKKELKQLKGLTKSNNFV